MKTDQQERMALGEMGRNNIMLLKMGERVELNSNGRKRRNGAFACKVNALSRFIILFKINLPLEFSNIDVIVLKFYRFALQQIYISHNKTMILITRRNSFLVTTARCNYHPSLSLHSQ